MISLILSIVGVLVVTGAFFANTENRAKISIVLGIGLTIVGCFISIFVSTVNPITEKQYSYNKLASSSKIIALKDNNLSSGTFFLGCGSVNNDEYYCYYTVSDEGDIEYNKLSATDDNVKLRYCGDNEQPRVEIYYETVNTVLIAKPNIWKLSTDDYISYHKYSVGDVVTSDINEQHQQTIIYIPEGSIEQNYKIDME